MDDVGQTEHLHKNELSQFLELIAPTQSEIILCGLPKDVDIFKALDSRNSQVKSFGIFNCPESAAFQDLVKPKQAKYTRYLMLRWVEISSPLLFQNFTALVQPGLENIYYCGSETINITDCLNMFPDTLKGFSMHDCTMVFEPANCKWSSIENLIIGCDIPTSDLMDTVSSCFPKLINLSLEINSFDSLNLILQSLSLNSATFRIRSKAKQGFSFKCPTQIEPEHYLFSKGKGVRVEYEDIRYEPQLLVVSFTKKELDFSSIYINLVS